MKKILLVIVAIVIIAGGVFVWRKNHTTNTSNTPAGQTFDTKQHSLDDPASIWVIANKRRPLQPSNYTPNDLTLPLVTLRLSAHDEEMQLRAPAATALEQLFAAAKTDGLYLMLSSAFRSYGYQKGLYNRYVQQQGQAVADTQSARPGYSEHQTGLAADIEPASRECEVEQCFADLPEGQWVAQNAYKYGFVVRYQKDQDQVTGYIYEPWHLRYVGKELAQELHNQSNPTLEVFFDLPAAPNYQ